MSELVQFKKEYLLMVSRMTDQVFQLIKAGQTKDEILTLLSKKDFKKVILADQEFKKAYNECYYTVL